MKTTVCSRCKDTLAVVPKTSGLPPWVPEAVCNRLKALSTVAVILSPYAPARTLLESFLWGVTSSGTLSVCVAPSKSKTCRHEFMPFNFSLCGIYRDPTNTHISSLKLDELETHIHASPHTQMIPISICSFDVASYLRLQLWWRVLRRHRHTHHARPLILKCWWVDGEAHS